MTVKELIGLLATFPPEIQVAFRCCSEQVLLVAEDLKVKDLCLPRPDLWVQDRRPDMPTQPYLLFPGM